MFRGVFLQQGASGTPVSTNIDATARSLADAAQVKVDAIAPKSGDTIAVGQQAFLSGNLWSNDTAADIVVPATINDTTLAAAGLTKGAAATPNVKIESLVPNSGDVVPVNELVILAGDIWHNNTALPITVPAVINDITLAVAGFSKDAADPYLPPVLFLSSGDTPAAGSVYLQALNATHLVPVLASGQQTTVVNVTADGTTQTTYLHNGASQVTSVVRSLSDGSVTDILNATAVARAFSGENIQRGIRSELFDRVLPPWEATNTGYGNNASMIQYVVSNGRIFQAAVAVVPAGSDPVAVGNTDWTEISPAGGVTLVDEDDMVSNSATLVPSQQSVKAYVDRQDAFLSALGTFRRGMNLGFLANREVSLTAGTFTKWNAVTKSADVTNIPAEAVMTFAYMDSQGNVPALDTAVVPVAAMATVVTNTQIEDGTTGNLIALGANKEAAHMLFIHPTTGDKVLLLSQAAYDTGFEASQKFASSMTVPAALAAYEYVGVIIVSQVSNNYATNNDSACISASEFGRVTGGGSAPIAEAKHFVLVNNDTELAALTTELVEGYTYGVLSSAANGNAYAEYRLLTAAATWAASTKQLVWPAPIVSGITDWATAKAYVVGDYVNEGNQLYKALVDHTAGVFATDLAANNWVEVSPSAAALPRVFATNTAVNPATAGAPTLAEMQTYATAQTVVSNHIVYNGTDLPAGAPTYVYQVDAAGTVTLVLSPAASALPTMFVSNTALNPAVAGAPTAAEFQAYITAQGISGRFVRYTGTDLASDIDRAVWVVDVAGTATLLYAPIQNAEGTVNYARYDFTAAQFTPSAVVPYGDITTGLTNTPTIPAAGDYSWQRFKAQKTGYITRIRVPVVSSAGSSNLVAMLFAADKTTQIGVSMSMFVSSTGAANAERAVDPLSNPVFVQEGTEYYFRVHGLTNKVLRETTTDWTGIGAVYERYNASVTTKYLAMDFDITSGAQLTVTEPQHLQGTGQKNVVVKTSAGIPQGGTVIVNQTNGEIKYSAPYNVAGYNGWMEIESLGSLVLTANTGNPLDVLRKNADGTNTWLPLNVNAAPRHFITEAALAPALAGAPTNAEVQAYVTAQNLAGTLAFYTGTNVATDLQRAAWYVDGVGVATVTYALAGTTYTVNPASSYTFTAAEWSQGAAISFGDSSANTSLSFGNGFAGATQAFVAPISGRLTGNIYFRFYNNSGNNVVFTCRILSGATGTTAISSTFTFSATTAGAAARSGSFTVSGTPIDLVQGETYRVEIVSTSGYTNVALYATPIDWSAGLAYAGVTSQPVATNGLDLALTMSILPTATLDVTALQHGQGVGHKAVKIFNNGVPSLTATSTVNVATGQISLSDASAFTGSMTIESIGYGIFSQNVGTAGQVLTCNADGTYSFQ
ncbi:MAG: hypothetical protein U5N55_11700 [Cypionkella sp.]|nr:hypothetical protein [Cypionkella sp.]